MAWNPNLPTVSRLVGSGCLTCPEGSSVSGDDGLGALETLAKNIMVLERPEFDGPKFPLSELPIKQARSQHLGGDDFTLDYDYHIPNLHQIGMHNINVTQTKAQRVMDAYNNCGPDAIVSSAFDMASIACNPPRGQTGVMGKDVSPITSFAAPLEMGPFCITMFQNFDHLKRIFARMQAHYPNAAMQVVNYNKIRNFVASSYNNAAAVAGTRRPRFSPFQFIDRPNSYGSLEWFFEAIDHIVSHATSKDGWRVSMSRRLFRRWLTDYAAANNVTLNADFAGLQRQIGEYNISFNSADQVTLITDRLNYKVTIDFSKDPIYVTDNQIGADTYEWNFQPYFITRPGDDTRSGESAGFVREKNPDYGAACSACPDGERSLSELILIYNDEGLEYEAFPQSPFAGAGLEHLSTDLQALWGSLQIRYYFGSEVDQYFLQPLFAHLGNCPSNIDNTWFAGRMWFSFRQRLLRKRAFGSLLVKVPGLTMANPEADGCLQEAYCDPIVLTPAQVEAGSRLCVENGEEPDDPTGVLRPECSVEITRPAETSVFEIDVTRHGGLAGELEVGYATANGTATAGVDYTSANGTLEIAEGQNRGVVQITILGGDCVEADAASESTFVINWTGADLDEGACTQTVVTIKDRVCCPDEEPTS